MNLLLMWPLFTNRNLLLGEYFHYLIMLQIWIEDDMNATWVLFAHVNIWKWKDHIRHTMVNMDVYIYMQGKVFNSRVLHR
jgi:hypothetical protein